jgi:hypothetical protein
MRFQRRPSTRDEAREGRTYRYYTNCVNWPTRDVHKKGGLIDMINQATGITRDAFLRHVSLEELRDIEQQLGYATHPSQGLTMAGDYCVSYHKSKLHGKTVYYFQYSRIEYVFK